MVVDKETAGRRALQTSSSPPRHKSPAGAQPRHVTRCHSQQNTETQGRGGGCVQTHQQQQLSLSLSLPLGLPLCSSPSFPLPIHPYPPFLFHPPSLSPFISLSPSFYIPPLALSLCFSICKPRKKSTMVLLASVATKPQGIGEHSHTKCRAKNNAANGGTAKGR